MQASTLVTSCLPDLTGPGWFLGALVLMPHGVLTPHCVIAKDWIHSFLAIMANNEFDANDVDSKDFHCLFFDLLTQMVHMIKSLHCFKNSILWERRLSFIWSGDKGRCGRVTCA